MIANFKVSYQRVLELQVNVTDLMDSQGVDPLLWEYKEWLLEFGDAIGLYLVKTLDKQINWEQLEWDIGPYTTRGDGDTWTRISYSVPFAPTENDYESHPIRLVAKGIK